MTVKSSGVFQTSTNSSDDGWLTDKDIVTTVYLPRLAHFRVSKSIVPLWHENFKRYNYLLWLGGYNELNYGVTQKKYVETVKISCSKSTFLPNSSTYQQMVVV